MASVTGGWIYFSATGNPTAEVAIGEYPLKDALDTKNQPWLVGCGADAGDVSPARVTSRSALDQDASLSSSAALVLLGASFGFRFARLSGPSVMG